jgi:hypothetical protein
MRKHQSKMNVDLPLETADDPSDELARRLNLVYTSVDGGLAGFFRLLRERREDAHAFGPTHDEIAFVKLLQGASVPVFRYDADDKSRLQGKCSEGGLHPR